MSEKKVADGSDGYVSIEISEDRMEAYGTFFSSTGTGRNLEAVQAESALNANKITHGIDQDIITESIEKCNAEQKAIENVLLAKGTKPVKASPEHINLKPDFFNRTKNVIRKDGSVDYKESSPFVMVKKGESVGRIFSYRPGVNGTDVTGEAIPYKAKEMQIFKAGENLEAKDGVLVSIVHGRFIIDGDLISVTEVLEIGTDVDYHTGNVSFAGDIIVDGVIHDGFRVAAGGSIRCKKLIKNAEVLSRGDLQLDLGVKGRGNALVRINGMIRCKFLEQGTVESRTGLEVSTSILSSRINTLGKLKMGQKGTIVTSDIVAEKGIEVFNLGRENCAPSTIWCGISFVENRKLDHLKTRHEVLNTKISKLEMKSKPPLELINQMKIALTAQEREIEKLEKEICTFEEAKVIVHGTLFAGTEIKICKYRKKIEKNETRVSVSLNKENLQLNIEPII
jgi:uncharacterized protein